MDSHSDRVCSMLTGGVVSVLPETVSVPVMGVVSAVQAGAFWGAVVLPMVSLPMLVTSLDTRDGRLLFVALVVLNVVLLVLGHRHRAG
ncbi:MAG: hypothetical protein ACI9K3_000815 [Halovenus sp.]|jgi:hypothetical protein